MPLGFFARRYPPLRLRCCFKRLLAFNKEGSAKNPLRAQLLRQMRAYLGTAIIRGSAEAVRCWALHCVSPLSTFQNPPARPPGLGGMSRVVSQGRVVARALVATNSQSCSSQSSTLFESFPS